MKTNKELLELYPWLTLRSNWTDEIVGNEDECELDLMPLGWRIAFADELCEKINELLVEADYVNEYRITEIKEKWGELRWYTSTLPESIYKRHEDLIDEYSKKSNNICIMCGKVGNNNHYSYVPVCDECWERENNGKNK